MFRCRVLLKDLHSQTFIWFNIIYEISVDLFLWKIILAQLDLIELQ